MHAIQRAGATLILCLALPAARAADEGDRAASLLNAFTVMCGQASPDFEQLAAKAKAMRMQVLLDDTSTAPGGESILEKAWIGSFSGRTLAFRIEKMSGAKGVVTSCAMEGPVPDLEAFGLLFRQRHGLGEPTEVKAVEGTRTAYWDNAQSDGASLVMRDSLRGAGSFVQVKAVSRLR